MNRLRMVLIPVLISVLLAPTASDASSQQVMTPTLTIWMFASSLQVRTSPDSRVTIAIENAEGKKASGGSTATRDGIATIFLEPKEDGADATIAPGDSAILTIDDINQPPITIPPFAIDVDDETNRIFGIAPPLTSMSVILGSGEDLGQYTATPDGLVSIDVGSRRDLVGGDYGDVTIQNYQGLTLIARFAVLDVSIVLNADSILVRATPGSRIEVDIPTHDAVSVPLRPRLISSTNIEFTIDGLPPANSGDTFAIRQISFIPGGDRRVEVQVPVLSTAIDRDARRVFGHAEAGSRVHIALGDASAVSGFRSSQAEDITVSEAGAYSMSIDPAIQPGPGWRSNASQTSGRVTYIAIYTLPAIKVALYGTNIRGVMTPSVTITATLRGDDGQIKGQGITFSDGRGDFAVAYDPVSDRGSAVFVEPGDSIMIEEHRSGDALLISVPRLTITTNVTTDSVSGDATGGTKIRLVDSSGKTIGESYSVGGQYLIDMAGQIDIKPGDSGRIVFISAAGYEFHSSWSALRMELILAQDDDNGIVDFVQIKGKGPRGREVDIRITDEQGRLVGGGGGRVSPSRSILEAMDTAAPWSVVVKSATGDSLDVRAGDLVNLVIGDDGAKYSVPRFEATVDIDADALAGTIPPATSIGCQAKRQGAIGGSTLATTSSNAQGNFTIDFGSGFDVQFGDEISCAIELAPDYRVVRYIRAPGLIVDIDDAEVTGTWASESLIDIELSSALGAVRSRVTLTTTKSGAFVAAFRTLNAEMVVPGEGDVISVRSIRTGRVVVSARIPEMDIQLLPNENEVRGRATPGGVLLLTTAPRFRRAGAQLVEAYGVVAPALGTGGEFRVNGSAFGPAIRLFPGLRVSAQYRTPEGHLVRSSRTVPIINAQYGGARVCGYVAENQTVEIKVANQDGLALGGARSQSDSLGRFDVELKNAAGGLIAVLGGQAVTVTFGMEAISMIVPRLDAAVTWEASHRGRAAHVTVLRGDGPPLTELYVEDPASGCLEASTDRLTNVYLSGTDMNGEFEVVMDEQRHGFESQLSLYTRAEHRIYLQLARSLLQVYVHSDRISGLLWPGSTATLRVREGGGSERGTVQVLADGRGRFDVSVRDASGRSIEILPGDVVELDGSDPASVVIEELDFDFSADEGLIGRSPATQVVRMEFGLRDGRVVRGDRRAEPDGRLVFGMADVAVRDNWSFREVVHVRLVLETREGHQIIREADVGSVPDPGSSRTVIYLPRSVRR